MKQTIYRVETFIIPTGNEYCTDFIETKSDNMKTELTEDSIANTNIREKESSCKHNGKNDSLSMEKENMQNVENSLALEKIERNLADRNKVKEDNPVNFFSSLDISRTQYEILYNANSGSVFSNVLDTVCNLSTVEEHSEDFENEITEICYHGCKNGCSATVPTPQQVTAEVFKENWLQRLEDIKQKEEILRNKETNLQNRERILFKKENEIKILEQLLKDRINKIDLYLKENKHLQESLKISSSASSELYISPDSKELDEEIHPNNSTENSENINAENLNLGIQNMQTQDTVVHINKNVDTSKIMCKNVQEKVSVSSSCSSDNSVPERKKSKKHLNSKTSISLKSSSKFTYGSSNRTKKPCKVSYEDLDTTLSADIGDLSFVQTSQKFNPELYRKPYAFTRSFSERRRKYTNNRSDVNLQIEKLENLQEESQLPTIIEQSKILRRVTENISASQDKGTKFQHYGLIDHNAETDKVSRMENEEKYSYLNLETSNRLLTHPKLIRSLKERPISWNEETNEWLLKKRKAYNMTMKKTVSEECDNKENIKCNAKINKSEKMPAKKGIKTKIYTMFR